MKILKKIYFLWGLLLIIILGASFLFYCQSKAIFLSVIPHFMIQPGKVDEFYSFLKETYFKEKLPDTIVLISPNHFFPEQKAIEWLCETTTINYHNEKLQASALKTDAIDCTWWVFYSRWESIYVKDHWLGEHFQRLNKYFPNIPLIPLAIPSYDMRLSENLSEIINHLPWTTFVIASVDFSHYKSEIIAKENDAVSWNILSHTWNFNKLKYLDVDCPACLGVVYRLWEKKKIQQRYRDSSSTIVGYDLEKENTSRQFLYWKD